MSSFFNSHFVNYVDQHQFGCTVGRSTTHALLKLTDAWFKGADNSRNITRIIFVDFSKAFDLIDHNVLMSKFRQYNFPDHIAVWGLDFLQGRTQFVQFNNSKSDMVITSAGSPQGTLDGPNDFKLLINDLLFDCLFAKYVDDTTVSSTSTDLTDTSIQTAAEHLMHWTLENGMKINEAKTKEMILYFGNNPAVQSIEPILINDKSIERVTSFKLLGVIISSDLSWDMHVEYMLCKV